MLDVENNFKLFIREERESYSIYYKSLSSDKRYKIAALLDSRRKTSFQLIENQYFNLCEFFKKEKIILCSNSKLLNIENSLNPRYF
jgi:hypothetical protein